MGVRLAACTAVVVGCGPTAGGAEASATAGSADSTTGTADGSSDGDASSSGPGPESTDGSDGTGASTGGQVAWPDPELLTVLEGSADLEAGQLVRIDGYLHVSTLQASIERRHWVVDGADGAILAESAVAGSLVATSSFVYAAGDRTGGPGFGGEWALTRTDPAGDLVEELAVGDIPMYAVAASADDALVYRFVQPAGAELWSVADGSSMLQFVVGLGDQTSAVAVFDDDRLLQQEWEGPSVLAVDLVELTSQPLLVPPSPATALFADPTSIFIGTESGIYRADKPGLVLAEVDDSPGIVFAIDGDETGLFWLLHDGTTVGLYHLGAGAAEVEQVPIEAGVDNDFGRLADLAVSDDAVFVLRRAHVAPGIEHAGSLWRLARP